MIGPIYRCTDISLLEQSLCSALSCLRLFTTEASWTIIYTPTAQLTNINIRTARVHNDTNIRAFIKGKAHNYRHSCPVKLSIKMHNLKTQF